MASERTIIICLATSPHATKVAREGLRFASMLDAEPVFLNVGPDSAERRKMLEEIVREGGSGEGDRGSLLIRAGDPYEVIAAAATELGAEIIVLGALKRDPALVRLW